MNTIYQSMNHQNSNHRFKYFNLMALMVLLLLSCSTKEPVKEATEKPIEETVVSLNKEQLKNAALVMGNISTQNMQAVIQVNGVVDVPPQSLVSVSFPLGGYLKNSHLLPGTSVRKGEVLAVMEDQSYVQLQQDF